MSTEHATQQDQQETSAGGHPKIGTLVKEGLASLIQGIGPSPMSKSHMYLCAVHAYASDPSRQVIAHHYCRPLTKELHQCLIFDTAGGNAKLIGVEYIISRGMFESLSEEEKKLWHSHVGEIKEGILTAPGIPEEHEKNIMKDLIDTYGKTFHFWQVDRGDQIPLGLPQIMGSISSANEIRPELLKEMENATHSEVAKKKQHREGIEAPTPLPQADVWKKGLLLEVTLKENRMTPGESEFSRPMENRGESVTPCPTENRGESVTPFPKENREEPVTPLPKENREEPVTPLPKENREEPVTPLPKENSATASPSPPRQKS